MSLGKLLKILKPIMPMNIFPLNYHPSYLHMVFDFNPHVLTHLNKIHHDNPTTEPSNDIVG